MALFNFKSLFTGEIPEMSSELRNAMDIIHMSRYAIALTGAGISVKSGIPDFRGPQGIWKQLDINAFFRKNIKDYEKVWSEISKFMKTIKKASPNDAHKSLAFLERMGYIKSIVTQNIDDLHQKAGSQNVIEFHGNFKKLKCENCNSSYNINNTKIGKSFPPRCPNCGEILFPEIALFGDEIKQSIIEKVTNEVNWADVLIIIGTSATVYPASEIPQLMKEKGAYIIEINIEPTYLTDEISDVFVRCQADIALNKLSKGLNAIL